MRSSLQSKPSSSSLCRRPISRLSMAASATAESITSHRRAAPISIHGSVYDYFENTFLNAGIPFTNNGRNEHTKVVKHLSDGGFSIGGPVWIPKVYNGKNKTVLLFQSGEVSRP